jgi:spore coat protein U-like protein
MYKLAINKATHQLGNIPRRFKMRQQRFGKHSRFTLAMLSALAVGGAMVGSAAQAATTATATATATVIRPIAITKATDLSFGKFAPGTAASDVTVFTDGTRGASASGSYLVPSAGGTAGKFDVTGEGGATYAITYTVPTTVVSGTDNMPITVFAELSATAVNPGSRIATGTLTGSGAGSQSIYVGAKLDVGAGQAPGSYTGSIDVAVNYN